VCEKARSHNTHQLSRHPQHPHPPPTSLNQTLTQPPPHTSSPLTHRSRQTSLCTMFRDSRSRVGGLGISAGLRTLPDRARANSTSVSSCGCTDAKKGERRWGSGVKKQGSCEWHVWWMGSVGCMVDGTGYPFANRHQEHASQASSGTQQPCINRWQVVQASLRHVCRRGSHQSDAPVATHTCCTSLTMHPFPPRG
jgi:hypothetical protein